MKTRLLYGSGILALAILVTLLVWQGSFSFGDYGPDDPIQTSLYWAVSTLVFLLTMTIGFMLFRTGVKLYIERQSNREGSRIRTKMVVGALALSFLPVFFQFLLGYSLLNRNLDKWFSRPAEGIVQELGKADRALKTGSPIDLAESQRVISNYLAEYDKLALNRKSLRGFYLLLLSLLTLFILFVATWIALFLARQISVPISALLEAAGQVRKGNLAHRVKVSAVDELASLVRSFNAMTEALEANRRELESRRRFTETILESIPTGVISLSPDGRILRVNAALSNILPRETLARAEKLEELFSREDTAEIKHLMKRARRTGLASSQLELSSERRKLQLAVTVSALETKLTSGFVIVLEDTSELLRAQKAAAWHEVARRIAHEIKNPLTPIALSAERILRQLDRAATLPEAAPIFHECATTIVQEVESLKALVDEFAQFARFPAAQPAPADLNEVVESGLAVFAGRLEGIHVTRELASDLPVVGLDREQFKRVVINLVDNAAEAMQDSLVKRLFVSTSATSAETVELVIADTGCGISPEEKEKLFLPYFSTKGRGTGLGLAIVNHIVAEHGANIRAEDNFPAGARFVVEIPALVPAEPAEVRT
jgi:PAS domain S-box-containing protein